MKRWYAPLVVLVVIWLSGWLYVTRYAMLDDALIHLRYAAWLNQLHTITYDGVHPTFGASSLLYVGLLAVLRSLTTTALLPKIVSVIFYLASVGFVLTLIRRMEGAMAAQLLFVLLLASFLSPMGIRWLTDGMETSLVVVMTLSFAGLAFQEAERRSVSAVRYAGLMFFGFLLVLLRIELAALIALASLAILALRLESVRTGSERLRTVIASSHFSVGAVVAVVGIRLAFGTFLPDTALAKSGSFNPLVVVPVLRVIVGSFLLGLGALALWIVSAALLLRVYAAQRFPRQAFFAWLYANAPFPVIFLLAMVRGQSVQGIRYLLWCFLFSITWNALQLWKEQRVHLSASASIVPWLKAVGVVYAIFILCVLPFDWRLGTRAMLGRGATFLEMRSDGLDVFRGKTVVAGDVGFIGYFSGADVCDTSGLVDGREQAKRTPAERMSWCANSHPAALFVQADQAKRLDDDLPVGQWIACQHVDFRNVEGLDRHYLVVPPEDAESLCARFGGPIGALSEFVPGLR
jgi:hypothetical protein